MFERAGLAETWGFKFSECIKWDERVKWKVARMPMRECRGKCWTDSCEMALIMARHCHPEAPSEERGIPGGIIFYVISPKLGWPYFFSAALKVFQGTLIFRATKSQVWPKSKSILWDMFLSLLMLVCMKICFFFLAWRQLIFLLVDTIVSIRGQPTPLVGAVC